MIPFALKSSNAAKNLMSSRLCKPFSVCLVRIFRPEGIYVDSARMGGSTDREEVEENQIGEVLDVDFMVRETSLRTARVG